MQLTTMAVAFAEAEAVALPSPLAAQVSSALKKGRGRRRVERVERKRMKPEQQRRFDQRLEKMGLYSQAEVRK